MLQGSGRASLMLSPAKELPRWFGRRAKHGTEDAGGQAAVDGGDASWLHGVASSESVIVRGAAES